MRSAHEASQRGGQVKRNPDRFPTRFMFQLTPDETDALRSQIATSNESRGGRRYFPHAFSEHGVVMLSAVLNSARAVGMSIRVVDAFVRVRELIASNKTGSKEVNAEKMARS